VERPRLVLIAEDDPDNRRGYAEYLSHLGYRVAQATTGPEALARMRELQPDLLLLDLALPDMDGWEVARHVRADPSVGHTPIIAWSACVFPSDVERATDAGCDLFLDKPCVPMRVAEAIESLLVGRPVPEGR
jgi:two-component system, cell cycle response regulator DivK